MHPYLKDVLDVCLRLLHVIAGIAWIGASFYFVRLDLELRPPKSAHGAGGGGGLALAWRVYDVFCGWAAGAGDPGKPRPVPRRRRGVVRRSRLFFAPRAA